MGADFRDYDNDGIENSLDPCSTVANPNWDPRLKSNDPSYTGDPDKDGANVLTKGYQVLKVTRGDTLRWNQFTDNANGTRE